MRSSVTSLYKFFLVICVLIGLGVAADATFGKGFENFLFQGNTIFATNTNGNITLRPNGSGVVQYYGKGDVMGTATVDQVAYKSFSDNDNYIVDNSDSTKRVKFEVSGITNATTRTITVPDADGELCYLTEAQALSNKFLVNPNVQGYMIIGGTEREIRFYDDDTNYVTMKSVSELADNNGVIDVSAMPKVASAHLNCDGSSGVTNSYPAGAFTGVGNISSGACSVTIASSFFSAAPHCVVSYNGALSTSIVNVGMTVSSATAGSVDCVGDAGGSSALAACSAYDVYVICTGPR